MSWEGTYPAWLSRQQPTMEQLQRHRDAYMSKKTAEFWDSPEGIEVLKRRRDFERRHRQSGQRAKSTAVKARRSEKAAAALSEDGFALHPLDEADDSATWRSLAQFLLTSDPAQLGKGKDVTRSFGEYNDSSRPGRLSTRARRSDSTPPGSTSSRTWTFSTARVCIPLAHCPGAFRWQRRPRRLLLTRKVAHRKRFACTARAPRRCSRCSQTASTSATAAATLAPPSATAST